MGSPLATTDAAGVIQSTADFSPYGRQVLGQLLDGPSFTNHVADLSSGLVYMQQRFYDPTVGRFLSTDAKAIDTSNGHNFSRYWYGNNNPYSYIDPDGRDAALYWASATHVTVTIPYSMNGVTPSFTTTQINLQAPMTLSGVADYQGRMIVVKTVTVVDANGAGKSGVNAITVIPTTAGVTRTGTSETNKIGGNQITLGAKGPEAATKYTALHEIAHAAGAGDQYKGGLAVDGTTLPSDVPGADNIMKVLNGSGANNQTLNEIISAPTNTNTCAKGVSAPNGGC